MYTEVRLPGIPGTAWTSVSTSKSSLSRDEPVAERPVVDKLIGPDGCMDLVCIDGRIQVIGADTRSRLYQSVPGSVVTGVRFDPGVLPQLLGIPAHVLADMQVEAADVLPAGGLARAPVAVAVGHIDGAVTLAALAADLYYKHGRIDPLPVRAARALDSGQDIAGVANDLGYSTRQLRRRSLDWYGYGPKHLARVLRYQRAANHLNAGFSRTEAAAAAGYADASHLWRDERDLMLPA